MTTSKCVKNKTTKRSDASTYLIMQCIASFFIFIYVNLTNQIDSYSDIEIELWFFVRTITIFSILSLFKIKYNLSIKKSACILFLCFLFDYFIHILYFPEGSLFSALIILTFSTFLPFFLLSFFKYIYLKHIKSIIKKIPYKHKLYIKYIFILLVLFLLNIIIPVFISLLFIIVDLKTIFMIYMLYQILLSKFLPLITFIVSIFLQKSIFYRKKIAPRLLFVVIIGTIIDVIIYLNTDMIQLKDNPSIQISFIATFLPMYIVYLLNNHKQNV